MKNPEFKNAFDDAKRVKRLRGRLRVSIR